MGGKSRDSVEIQIRNEVSTRIENYNKNLNKLLTETITDISNQLVNETANNIQARTAGTNAVNISGGLNLSGKAKFTVNQKVSVQATNEAVFKVKAKGSLLLLSPLAVPVLPPLPLPSVPLPVFARGIISFSPDTILSRRVLCVLQRIPRPGNNRWSKTALPNNNSLLGSIIKAGTEWILLSILIFLLRKSSMDTSFITFSLSYLLICSNNILQ